MTLSDVILWIAFLDLIGPTVLADRERFTPWQPIPDDLIESEMYPCTPGPV